VRNFGSDEVQFGQNLKPLYDSEGYYALRKAEKEARENQQQPQ
jgi:hypothetical protein